MNYIFNNIEKIEEIYIKEIQKWYIIRIKR